MEEKSSSARGGARPGAGRRPSQERLERVSTRLPVRQFDQLVKLANQRDESVASVVRRLLVLRLN